VGPGGEFDLVDEMVKPDRPADRPRETRAGTALLIVFGVVPMTLWVLLNLHLLPLSEDAYRLLAPFIRISF